MIKYKLVCESCNLLFDSWFASSKEFENLKKKKLLSCHVCNSKKIEKTLMAPKLLKKSKNENFAYEARSIHYNNKKKNKGIYGTASKEDIMELKEEGIDTDMIPWLENKNN